MPWTSQQAKKHKKGLSTAQSRKWSKIANSVLADSGDEGKAIRIANSKTESNTVFDQLGEIMDDEGVRESPSDNEPPVSTGINVLVGSKDIGTFKNLGKAIETLTKSVKDFRFPLRWSEDGRTFDSSRGNVTFLLDGEPLDDESREDVELLIAGELGVNVVDQKVLDYEDEEGLGDFSKEDTNYKTNDNEEM